MRVALFIPCYVDQLAPSVGLAALEVLERAGCAVHYDPEQTCCGQPLLNLGAGPQARRLARAHLRRFGEILRRVDDCDAVVCPSASCVATVRRHLPELGVGQDREGLSVRERTYELSEFLVRVLGKDDLGARFPHRVALLQSCHGLRELELGVPSERGPGEPVPGTSEQLLSRVEGLELVFGERRDECCGFGGSFSVKFPEISARIGRARLRALERTGAEYVTATDVSCLLHLEGLRRREGVGPRAIHIAEILRPSEGA